MFELPLQALLAGIGLYQELQHRLVAAQCDDPRYLRMPAVAPGQPRDRFLPASGMEIAAEDFMKPCRVRPENTCQIAVNKSLGTKNMDGHGIFERQAVGM